MYYLYFRFSLSKITGRNYPWHDAPCFRRDLFMDETEYTFTDLEANTLYEVEIHAMNVLKFKYQSRYSNFTPMEGLVTRFRFRTAA